MPQGLRRSQFITTYGPGAIIEGKQGPRIIPALGSSDLFKDRSPGDFEITDSRLSKALLGDAGIIRLPSNAELGLPDSTWIYKTDPFPSWALCTHHQVLYHKQPGVGDSRRACPECPPLSNAEAAWNCVHQQAIRFVQVCLKGHLDDVDWVRIINHSCRPSHLYWRGAGSSLRNINIVCPDCNGHINLGLAYGRSWKCSGCFPEQGKARSTCDADAKMIQRGASNLRIPEIHSSLTIPPSDTRLSRLLETRDIRIALTGRDISTKQEFTTLLDQLIKEKLVGPALTEVKHYTEQEILTTINHIKGPLPESNREMRLQEFEALRRAAEFGAPPQHSSTPGAPSQFEVIRPNVREFLGPNDRYLIRITPVSRLRVVMVQKGYRRLDPLEGDIVDCRYIDDRRKQWYLGTELYGEGIFVDLAPSSLAGGHHFPLKEHDSWLRAWHDPQGYGQRIQVHSDDRDYLHPVFVWWHTLAHRLINALSIDSGYSSTAIRERVYLRIDETTGEASGGVLLYTAQPGGDGSLGGMIALVPQFNRVLDVALKTIDTCSNDPLCCEERFSIEKYNGAACYACQLVSETSCEHRNTRLDRTLLKENLP